MFDMENVSKLPTLRELRKRKFLEIPELARIVDARENTVYRWERGEAAPRLLEAMKISSALGVRVDEVNWWPRGVAF